MARNNKTEKVKTDEQDFRDFHIVVAIEWDGAPPKMTWYDRLHKMGIYVRGGNREEFESPLARRKSRDKGHNNGIVFQEGLYLCRNDSVAMQIGDQAREFGATNVLIGKMFLNEFSLDEKDIAVLEAFHQRMSQRGRKSQADAGTYTITCMDELATFESELDSQPVACPSCNSFRFQAHPGHMKTYQYPKSMQNVNAWDFWLRTRFTNEGGGSSTFEIPRFMNATKKNLVPLPPEYTAVHMDMPLVDIPPHVKVSGDMQLRIWDACYALSQMSMGDRVDGRLLIIGALTNIDENAGVFYSMAPPADGYDIVDLCILLNKELGKYL
jgi:hypothetical protein